MTHPIGYILKMYPRFSETFILNEVLELERQGVPIRIFSLKKPDDGRFHADIARVRAPVTYLPEYPLHARQAYYQAHREVYRWNPQRYLSNLLGVIRRRRAGALKRFLQAGYIAPILRREGIHHVHAHFASSATSVAHFLHRLSGTSYSFTAHAKDIYADTVSLDVLERKLHSARFAVTVSDYNHDYLCRRFRADRLVRIYNGLDLQQFYRNGATPAAPPLILAVGRLVEKKGFPDLIRACALLRQAGFVFQCRIVGKGPLEAEMRRLVQQLALSDCVALPGPLPREALLELYPRASVFVAPCVVGSDGNRDGLPTVLIEAMALGVPVVATDVTGIPELVEHDRTGLLVPQHNPDALAAAIRRLLGDPTLRASLAAAGRARVEQNFDLHVNVAQLARLLTEAATP